MGLKYSSLITHHAPLLLGIVHSFLIGRRRSLAADAAEIVGLMDPPPRIENPGMIPREDAFLLIANHFESPEWWVGWVAAAITDAVGRARTGEGRELHWTMISEWRWFEVGGLWVANPLTSLLFPRACKVWGLIAMPARPSDVAGRARALMRVLERLGLRGGPRLATPEPVGLFPEGRASFTLEEAKPGTGTFLHLVSHRGVPILPAGVRQDNGALVVAFGRPFRLGDPPVGWPGDLDSWARAEAMASIARLLPRWMWGAYAWRVEQGE